MKSGNVVFVLHSHLPWVLNHGKWPHGEEWIHEAVAECYIPLLNVIEELKKMNIKSDFTISFSPVLLEQLTNPTYSERFIKYCEDKITLARKDEIRFMRWGESQQKIGLAVYWQNWYKDKLDYYKDNDGIVSKFKEYQDIGLIELMTCGATHLYYPIAPTDKSIDWQIKASIYNYEKHFGKKPKGTWIPECGYRPSYDWQSYLPIIPYNQKHKRQGVEELLAKNGMNYSFVDEDLILAGEFEHNSNQHNSVDILRSYWVKSRFSTTGDAIQFYGRHKDLAMQVWSGDSGYPGHGDYLDFHKKQDKSQLRYWRVTDNKLDMQFKQLYNPEWINDKIDLQTHHFIHHLEETSQEFKNRTGETAVICLPFDTELFGHWWFEGPEFIKRMIEGISRSPHIEMKTASDNLNEINSKNTISITEGSWGEENNHSVWMNENVKWCWEMIYNAENRFNNLLKLFDEESLHKQSKQIIKLINLGLKEIMLLQSSDWEFLIHNQSARDYAELRIVNHYSDFLRICSYIERLFNNDTLSKEEKDDIKKITKRDDLFPELNIFQYLGI